MGSIYIVNYLYNWNRYKIFKNTRTWIKYSVEVSYLISKAIDSNEEKRVMNLFDYYTGKINKKDTMNLVIENGSYITKEEIELRKKRFVKYAEKSNLWQGVISFNNDYLN